MDTKKCPKCNKPMIKILKSPITNLANTDSRINEAHNQLYCSDLKCSGKEL